MRSGLRGALCRHLFPSKVVGLVREVANPDLRLQPPKVLPCVRVLEPAVQKALVDRVALPLLHLQQVVDEIDGRRRNLLPWVGRVHERGVLDLIVDVLVFVEGKRSAETNVDDDPARPHVEGSIVSLVAQHFEREESNVQ